MAKHAHPPPCLTALLRPDSVAVLGASAKKMSVGNHRLVNLRRQGCPGDFRVVHPTAAATFARVIADLEKPTAGRVEFDGAHRVLGSMRARKARDREIQMAFQDPYISLDPRQLVSAAVEEILRAHSCARAATCVSSMHRGRFVPAEHTARILDAPGTSTPAACCARYPAARLGSASPREPDRHAWSKGMRTQRTAAMLIASPITNGDVSFWYQAEPVTSYRAALPHDVTADVAVIGAGLTGLWTAYYLARARPDLRIVVMEREFAGFGASGRNGGWLSAELAGARERYAASHGREGVARLLAAMRGAVDEVIAVAAEECIEADIVKDGMVLLARSQAQRARLRQQVAHERSWGAGESDIYELTAAELGRRMNVPTALSAAYTPHCARVQPAKLVRGLAQVVEAQGTVIYERTEATAVTPHQVTTDRGTVTAEHVVQCLEGFSASLPGQRRTWLPMNSSMIVTEPLPDAVMDQVGWHGAEVLGDSAHAYLYAQRTADGRIALGGRGNPYRFASRTDDNGRTQGSTVKSLIATLHALFPAAAGVRVDHAWCGVLAVPRDWCTTVNYDCDTGLAMAGGYVGSGLTTTNLAGRTLADLVLGNESELTGLPWVNRRIRRWEPEPLRWLGVQTMYALYRAADRRESRPDQLTTSRWARLADALSGR